MREIPSGFEGLNIRKSLIVGILEEVLGSCALQPIARTKRRRTV